MGPPSFEMVFRNMIFEWEFFAGIYNEEVTDHYTQLGFTSVPAGYKLLNESLNASIGVLKEKFKSLAESPSYYTIWDGDYQSILSLKSFCINRFRDRINWERRTVDEAELNFNEDTGTMELPKWDPEPGFSKLIDSQEEIKRIALDVMDGLSDRMILRAQHSDTETEPSLEALESGGFNLYNSGFEADCAVLIRMLELSTYAYKCFLSLSRKWHQPIEYSHYKFERSFIATINILKNRVWHLSLAYGYRFWIAGYEFRESMRFGIYGIAEHVYREYGNLHYDDLGPRPACDFDTLIELVKTIETDALAVLAKLEQTLGPVQRIYVF